MPSISSLGNFFLLLGWVSACYVFCAGSYAGIKKDQRAYQSSLRGTIVYTLSLFASITCLGIAFINDDYTNQFVWQFSESSMPIYYKISAIWGGMDGSMLLWAVFLALYCVLVALKLKSKQYEFSPFVLAVLSTSIIFFAGVVLFFTNPFRSIRADFIPPEGNGLNPLLQNPYMAIHPPTLYLGFTGLVVPYAFCLGALLGDSASTIWIKLTRKWTLIAWLFLTVGIALGGHWAYLELGWGGFWAWDPVENSSFLPWLTATAFLHSVLIEERKKMLKFWNVWLVVLTYSLTVFGTFLTRSGVVQSIHAFAETDIGWIFLVYLSFILISAVIITFIKRELLKPERQLTSFISKESAFLVNNLIFLSICFAVLWGVMFPVFSEMVTGSQQHVGPPFFNQVTVPLFLAMLLLMAIGPILGWRKADLRESFRLLLFPFIFALLLAILLVFCGIVEFYPVLAYSLSIFVITSIFIEFHRGIKKERERNQSSQTLTALNKIVKTQTSKYGGYIVHFGVAIAVIGITASMAHKIEKEFSLKVGESFSISRFKITLNSLDSKAGPNYTAYRTQTSLTQLKDGALVKDLNPEIRVYSQEGRENTSEVALKSSWKEDLYLVFVGTDDSGNLASFKLFINPLQIWVWIGVLIMAFGTIIVISPSFREIVNSEV